MNTTAPAQRETNYVVYWIFDEGCNTPKNSGYVGISSDLPRRFREHQKTQRFPETAKITVLLSGSQDDCLTVERLLRPHPGIGWNRARGGPDGYLYGLCKASREKLSNSLTGKKRKPFSAEHLARMSAANKGKTLSAETRQKMGASRKGISTANRLTDEVRRRMSEAKRGKKPWNAGIKGLVPWNKGKVGAQIAWNKGKKLSEETRKKIGDAQRGKIRGPLSAAARKKISEANRGKWSWNKGKTGLQIGWNKGKTLSQETRKKLSEARRHTIEAKHQNINAICSPNDGELSNLI